MAKKRSKRTVPPAALFVGAFGLLALAAIVGFYLWRHRGSSQPRTKFNAVHTAADSFAVSLFYSCDIQGRLLPVTAEEPDSPLGGIAHLAALYKGWNTQRSDRLIVDVGNAVTATHKQADAINPLLYKAFDTMGYAIANCGDGEAALSLDRLTALAKDRKVQMISANLLNKKDNKPIFPTYHVVAVNGVRVGFIGLLGQNIAPLKVGTGLTIGHPLEALRSALVAVQDRADLVVVLAYLSPEEIYGIARKFSGVHLILGGRCQATSAPYELYGRTLIAYLGDEGCTAGRLDDPSYPKPQPPQPTLPPFAMGRVTVLDRDLPDDPSMAPILAELQAALAGEKPPGADWDPKMPCTSSFVGSEVCKLCHIKEFYAWQASDHAGAYATLLQEDERQRDKEQGRTATKEAPRATRSPACLRCHATGYEMPGGYDPEKRDVVSAPATKEEGPKPKEPLKNIGPVRQDHLKGVGCEACHGGSRRHLGVAIKARFNVPGAPQLRTPVATRTCLRCHHGNRPCLEPGKSDLFELEEYLTKIRPNHW